MSRVWDDSLNPYHVLQLETGADSTESDIKKAYRKLARIKHPDKNPKANVEEFHLIQTAYEILCDPSAKTAYDNVLRAQKISEERWARQSEKRRRMREDLEKKERKADEERTTEEIAQATLRRELERLRTKLESEHQARTAHTRASDFTEAPDRSRLIKLKWTDKDTTWTQGNTDSESDLNRSAKYRSAKCGA